MQLDKLNNLLELFFVQYQKQDKNKIFLSSLKEPKKKFSWAQTFSSIIALSSEISKYIKKGDRCLLISENRPEWLISDLSIMLAQGITVPAYTTYIEKDYEYMIDDCQTQHSFCFKHRAIQQNKKSKHLKKDFIKKNNLHLKNLEGVSNNEYINTK